MFFTWANATYDYGVLSSTHSYGTKATKTRCVVIVVQRSDPEKPSIVDDGSGTEMVIYSQWPQVGSSNNGTYNGQSVFFTWANATYDYGVLSSTHSYGTKATKTRCVVIVVQRSDPEKPSIVDDGSGTEMVIYSQWPGVGEPNNGTYNGQSVFFTWANAKYNYR